MTLIILGFVFVVVAHGVDTTKLEHALQYAESLVGTPYGWWTGGAIPDEEPAWAANGPPPSASHVKSKGCFCAGIPNLMRRDAGVEVPCEKMYRPDPVGGYWCGGTGAYGLNFSSVAKRFNLAESDSYPRGTLLGRKYSGVSDQGHVAILLGPGRTGKILQSFSWCTVEPCPIIKPGVLSNYTLEQAHETFSFCKFTYAVLPKDWMPADETNDVVV